MPEHALPEVERSSGGSAERSGDWGIGVHAVLPCVLVLRVLDERARPSVTIERTSTHIAGEVVISRFNGGTDFEPRAVQRCAWCGVTLINATMTSLAVEPPEAFGAPPPSYPYWPAGDQVRVTEELTEARTCNLDYGWRRVKVEWLDPDAADPDVPMELPEDACLREVPK